MKFYDEDNGLFFDTQQAYEEHKAKEVEEKKQKQVVLKEKEEKSNEIIHMLQSRDALDKEIKTKIAEYCKTYNEYFDDGNGKLFYYSTEDLNLFNLMFDKFIN